MKRFRKHINLSILTLTVFLASSCGNSDADAEKIATAVAMTVAAKDTALAQSSATPTATVAAQTPTPGTTFTPTTNAPTFSPPTAPGPIGSGDPCLMANLIGETIPDGTIMQPGETFWKTWRLKNNGTCTWNSSYKIIFMSGDLMDGKLVYQFPDIVGPGDTAEITLLLRAPSSNGNFSSYWKLQSEWGGQFGVGQYDQPFYVQVNVNDSSSPTYGVTNVTYKIDRDPPGGCATNVWYTVNATITTNGPAKVRYQWLQSDGNNSGMGKTLKFSEAGSQTLSRQWSFHLGASPGTKWMQIIIHEPDYQEFPQATFVYDCK